MHKKSGGDTESVRPDGILAKPMREGDDDQARKENEKVRLHGTTSQEAAIFIHISV
jgi:hypothetical protein